MRVALFFFIFVEIFISLSFGATKNSPHLPITHCYHWLSQKEHHYLNYKYQYAEENNGELTFFTTPESSNGSVAGAGLYCAKSPSGSYNYGDRVIRIDFVDDMVLLDETTGVLYCGSEGETSENSASCAAQTWDVKFYDGGSPGGKAWYVIQNPMAIRQWSATSKQLISDLKASIEVNRGATRRHFRKTLKRMKGDKKGTFVYLFARKNLVQVLVENPEKLNSIPPLRVILELLKDQEGELSEEQRNQFLNQATLNLLKASDINYPNYRNVLKEDSSLFEMVKNNIVTNRSQSLGINPLVILQVYSDFSDEFQDFSEPYLLSLLDEVFQDEDTLNSMYKLSLVLNDDLSEEFESRVKSKIEEGVYKDDQEKISYSLLANKLGIEQPFEVMEGKIGAQPAFSFVLLNEDVVENQCFSFYEENNLKASISSATQISWSLVDGVDLVRSRPNDQWLSKESFCGSITSLYAEGTKLKPFVIKNDEIFKEKKEQYESGQWKYLVEGRIENIKYSFAGNDKESFNKQCSEFYKEMKNVRDTNDIDEIYWSLNGSEEQRYYNSSSYWTTEDAVCQQLFYSTFKKIDDDRMKAFLDELEKKIASQTRDNKYFLEGTIEGRLKYAFSGESSKELEAQCFSYHEKIQDFFDTNSIDEIYWSLNGSESKRLYNSSSYWQTKESLCDVLIDSSTSEYERNERYRIYVEKQKNLVESTRENVKFLLEGTMQSVEYVFVGDSYRDLEKQCHSFYEESREVKNIQSIDLIYWSLNASGPKRLYNSSSYWTTKDQVCGKLLESLP